MDNPSPRFTGIFLPVEILELENLTFFEMILLSWIDALYCPKHGGCYASNEYLGKRLRSQENTVAKSLGNLRKAGLIEDVSFDGRTRVIRSLINQYVDQAQSKAALDKNPIAIGKKSNPEMEKNPSKGTPVLIYESKDERKEIKRVASPPKPPSAIADSLTLLFLQKVEEHLPGLVAPNLKKWSQEMEKLMRIDGRTEAQILEAIGWFHNDLWLKANVLSVAAFRKQFDKIQSLRIVAKEKNRIQENRIYALALQKQYPKETQNLTFNSRCVMNADTGKDLSFDLPPETFEKEVIRLFGGRHASD